ncbi:MAG: hypothetical protein ACRDRL_09485, partial [Sciscionella sp.]
LQVDGGLFLDKGFEATGHGDLGAVRLFGAHITGQMSMQGAKLTNEAGPALHGEDLRVSAGLICDKRLRAAGHGELGAVRLFGAHITGQLSLRGAKLTNEAGPALHADGLQVDGGLLCDEGFLATGRGVNGAVRLLGAHITGQLSLAGAELINEAGPPLVGDRIQVNGDLLLDEGFRATGYGVGGAVRLLEALITGQLSLRGAELTNEAGLILDLEHADIKQIFLPSVVVCPQGATGKSTCGTTARRVNLSGLVYTSLEDRQWSQWLHLIARHTYGYQPQPYQQLASVRRATGHDADARKILIAQQQDLRERGEIGGFLIKIVHCLWGVLGGYGYRTGRIALALLIAVLAAGGMGFAAGNIPTSPGRYVAMHTAQTDPKDLNASPGPCSLTEQIGVGIDRGLPLSTTGIRSRCDFDTISRRGQAVTWASWVLQFLVWALVTLFVAGYVGLIRKVT